MQLTKRNLVVKLIVLNLVTAGDAYTKIWKYDVDIYDSKNWEDPGARTTCDGLEFETSSTAFDVIVDRLDVEQISLPLQGSLHLSEGAVIQLDSNSKDQMNCARVRTSQFRERSWSDPDSWTIEGESENQAVPHRERVPCEYDAVVFPKGWRSAPCSVDTFSISIESFTFGSQLLDNDDLKTLSRGAVSIFDYVPFMTITWQSCKDKSGCICGNDMATEGVCASRNFEEPNNCIDAIRPIGFCADICGASILFHYNHKFSLDAVRRSIRRYDSDTYASKVRKDNGVVIQVVFTEKEFTGASLDEAKQFYDELLTDKSLGAVDVELHSSSRYISKANVAGSALGLVFGTLIAVLAVFGVIFFVYSPKGEQLRLRERFRLPSRPLSFKTNLLARFDNSETAGLIIGEAASLSGSVQSLNSSFDNPMYGKAAPSVSAPGTSYDTEVNGKLRATTSEISVENPMYDLNKDLTDAIIEAVAEEEGELIDLDK